MRIKSRNEERMEARLEARGRMSCDSGVDMPDMGPLADASKYAATLGKELGEMQLAESQRQYDLTMQVAQPVLDAELALMQQSKEQGDDYYQYMVENQRPVWEALNAEAMQAGTADQQEQYAATAQADAMDGYTRALNVAARQGLRYGFSPTQLASQAGTQAGAQAQALAAAANQGRETSRNLGYAKKLDIAGLYSGLTGASQGAYGVALNSGNSAVANQTTASNSLLSGMSTAAGIQQQGVQQQLSGLSGVLSNSTSLYNSSAGDSSGAIIGGGLGVAAALI